MTKLLALGLMGMTAFSFAPTVGSLTQGVTVEEGTPLFGRIECGNVKFSVEKADRMWILGRNILENLGFTQYEVSNFAKKGFESRHNQVYWRQGNYVGVGAGATGTIYDFEKKLAERWTNTTSISSYMRFYNT